MVKAYVRCYISGSGISPTLQKFARNPKELDQRKQFCYDANCDLSDFNIPHTFSYFVVLKFTSKFKTRQQPIGTYLSQGILPSPQELLRQKRGLRDRVAIKQTMCLGSPAYTNIMSIFLWEISMKWQATIKPFRN